MIRILHVVSLLNIGGMESYIMNMYRRIDRTQIQFDFLVHHKERGMLEDEIEALGGCVHRMTVLDDFNLLKYVRDLRALYKAHPEYRIIHGHLGVTAYLYLGVAARQGIPWRILHSHVPSFMHTFKGYVKHMLFYLSPRHANIRYACSTEAGRYQFHGQDFTVIPNGIDVARFRYCPQSRQDVRSRLNLHGRFVVGHVGRFTREKNHSYMLKILRELKKSVPDAVLMLLGEGALMEDTRSMAKEMGLEDSVLFMGLQKDPSAYYQAMDAFILPSLYEGLPLVGIEAQCAALPCLFTETTSREASITPMSAYLPIGDENISRWSEALTAISRRQLDRSGMDFDASAFDVSIGTQKMAETYLRLWEQRT